MPKHLHSPLPASLRSESKKASRILEEFINPSLTGSPGTEIPASVLANAKGLLVFTVMKAGFLGSGRIGSGVIIVRLSDGSWSPPSAIVTVGGGFGGQVGFELTDFVFILNNASAVKTFVQTGSLTLGLNVSIATGPVGRSAEFAGGASKKGTATIFAYSKTKGLFGGVSIEGGMIVERKGANEKLYSMKVGAKQLLDGEIAPSSEVEPLMRVLASEIFHPRGEQRPQDTSDGRREPPAAVENQPLSETHSESRAPAEPHAESSQPTSSEQPGESNEVPHEIDQALPPAGGAQS